MEEIQPPAPSSQGHDQPVKPPGQKDVDAMPNVPAKNTAVKKKSASYGNSGGAKKMVSKKAWQADNGGESVNLNMAIMKKWFELRLRFLCRQALESARREDEAKLQSNDVQLPTPLSDEDSKRVKMMIGLAVVEKLTPDKDPKNTLQKEIDEFSNYDLAVLSFHMK